MPRVKAKRCSVCRGRLKVGRVLMRCPPCHREYLRVWRKQREAEFHMLREFYAQHQNCEGAA